MRAWCLSRSCASSAWSSCTRALSAGTHACTATALPCAMPLAGLCLDVLWHAEACHSEALTGTLGGQRDFSKPLPWRNPTSCSNSQSPSCAAGTGAALCGAHNSPVLRDFEQHAAHARAAWQHWRNSSRTLAVLAPSCCPHLSWTRTQASFVLRRAAVPSQRRLLVRIWVFLAVQACPGPAQALIVIVICCALLSFLGSQ